MAQQAASIRIADFKDVDRLSHGDFELFVAHVFEAAGFHDVHVTQVGRDARHGDGGLDIIARKAGRAFAIEVKHRPGLDTVGVDALHQVVSGAEYRNIRNRILVTNSYFSREVKERAAKMGRVDLIDRDGLYTIWLDRVSEIGRGTKIRAYQDRVVTEILEKVEGGHTRFLIEMATGLGKTIAAAFLTKRLALQQGRDGLRVLFLAHRIDIVLQSQLAFKNVLGLEKHSYSTCYNGNPALDTDFVFATPMTLLQQLGALAERNFDLVIIDEAHHVAARTYERLMERLNPPLLVGLTATPERMDGRDVMRFFGGEETHVGRYGLAWAIKNRHLATPHYHVMLDDIDAEKLGRIGPGFSRDDLDRMLFLDRKDDAVYEAVQEALLEKGIKHPKAIVFCKNIRHIRRMQQFFPAEKTAAVFSDGMDLTERHEQIRRFRDEGYHYILVCDLFNEGIDIPETNVLIFLRYTRSRTVWLQQLGRGLRKTPSKTSVEVLDFVGTLERIGEITELRDQVRRARRDPETEELKDPDEAFVDDTLDVSYSRSAARIRDLLENMDYRVSSRDRTLAWLREQIERRGACPTLEELPELLEDLTLDQIATHFDSYLGFVEAAVGKATELRGEIREQAARCAEPIFVREGFAPSLTGLSEMLREGELPLASPTELEEMLGSSEELEELLRENAKPAPRPAAEEGGAISELLDDLLEQLARKGET